MTARTCGPRALAVMLALGLCACACASGAARAQVPPGQPDLAFGAFQRGYYLTALREAMKRIEADANDAPAMALMGELYRDGLGLRRVRHRDRD